MKNFIQNELVCLRASEPIGSDRYEELSKAIQWLEEHTTKEKNNKPKEQKGKYAHTTIRWKDDGVEEEAIIAIGIGYDKKHDYDIVFYCENDYEYDLLKEYNNGEDFVIIGCTLFTETLD